MIGVRVALPGEGKSLTMSIQIKEWLDQGKTIYTNLHCNEERENYHYFNTKDWEIILKLQDGIIVFDEGQDILDSRNWINLPIGFRHLLTKGRHEGLDLIVITQHVKQLDVASRRLFDPREIKTVFKVFSFRKYNFGLYLVFDAEFSGDEEVKTDGFPDFVWATKEDFEYYNSHALRSQKPPVGTKNCAQCGRFHELSTELSTVAKLDTGVYAESERVSAQSDERTSSQRSGIPVTQIQGGGDIVIKKKLKIQWGSLYSRAEDSPRIHNAVRA